MAQQTRSSNAMNPVRAFYWRKSRGEVEDANLGIKRWMLLSRFIEQMVRTPQEPLSSSSRREARPKCGFSNRTSK